MVPAWGTVPRRADKQPGWDFLCWGAHLPCALDPALPDCLQMRNLHLALMLSQGTPMLLIGERCCCAVPGLMRLLGLG